MAEPDPKDEIVAFRYYTVNRPPFGRRWLTPEEAEIVAWQCAVGTAIPEPGSAYPSGGPRYWDGDDDCIDSPADPAWDDDLNEYLTRWAGA